MNMYGVRGIARPPDRPCNNTKGTIYVWLAGLAGGSARLDNALVARVYRGHDQLESILALDRVLSDVGYDRFQSGKMMSKICWP